MNFNNPQREEIEMIDFRRQQMLNAQMEYKNYWNKVLRDGCCTMVSLIILIILLIASNGATCGDNLRFILIFTIVFKSILLIPVEVCYLLCINFNLISAANIQLFKLLSVLPWIGWYLYVCVKFFQNDNTCTQESVPLYVAVLLIVIEAFVVYFVMGCCICAI